MAARRRALDNAAIANALRELAIYLEMDAVPFKPRAYEKAALVVEGSARALSEIDAAGGVAALAELPGIGEGIAGKIHELLASGRIDDLERLRAKRPVDALALTSVEGIGPKGLRALYDELGVRTLDDLQRACRAGRVRELPHFGARSEAKIARALEFVKQSRGRRLLGDVLPLAREIEARLAALPSAEAAAVAGSVRRCKETIGDLDFVVASRDARSIVAAFAALPEVADVLARGPTKGAVRLASGLDADLRVVPRESFGAALAYFTGSKAHNVALRRRAQERGLKLNEYGLYRGERALAGRTEQEIYAALDLPWIPPELREDAGELEAAERGELPALIDYGDLRGDLQVHTDWTDGSASIAEMARAARELGLEYVAITDHTRDLAMARGSDEARLLEQAAEVARLNARERGIRVLSGAEVNVREDGSLDVADEALARLDVVGAAVHTHFHLPRAAQTARLVRAMESPHVDVLFHPSARAIGRREPIDVDVDALCACAVRTGTALEIDAIPDRMDLRDEHVRRAVAAGAKLVIDSDAHHPDQLRFADELGVAVARRGWARKADVLNALPLPRLLRALKGGARRAP